MMVFEDTVIHTPLPQNLKRPVCRQRRAPSQRPDLHMQRVKFAPALNARTGIVEYSSQCTTCARIFTMLTIRELSFSMEFVQKFQQFKNENETRNDKTYVN